MKKPLKPAGQLADQRDALTMYLDALLNEVDEEEEHHILSNDYRPLQLQLTHQDSLNDDASTHDPASTPSAVVSSSTAPVVVFKSAAGLEQNTSREPFDDFAPENQIRADSGDAQPPFTPPAWVVPRCQVLAFAIANMQMAAPLEKLNGIIPLPERITSLPGQSPWFLGLVRNRNQNVQVVDLFGLIRPGSCQGAGEEHAAGKIRYILLVDGGRWGILCDSIDTVFTLEAQQVSWQQSRRIDFILGTVIDKMCSLLSVDRLVDRLNNGAAGGL